MTSFYFFSEPYYIPSGFKNKLLVLHGYTFSQNRQKYKRLWYCSQRKNGCKAKVIMDNKGEFILAMEGKHHHSMPVKKRKYESWKEICSYSLCCRCYNNVWFRVPRNYCSTVETEKKQYSLMSSFIYKVFLSSCASYFCCKYMKLLWYTRYDIHKSSN